MPKPLQPAALGAQIVALARRMDWYRGLRAALALCVPLVLGDLFSLPNLAWAALGGFEAIISDAGGPYRLRLGSISTVALGGALGSRLARWPATVWPGRCRLRFSSALFGVTLRCWARRSARPESWCR